MDLDALRHYRCNGSEPTACVVGLQYNWNYNYHDNPYWVQFVNSEGDERDRMVGDISADYQVNDWITVTGKVERKLDDNKVALALTARSAGTKVLARTRAIVKLA